MTKEDLAEALEGIEYPPRFDPGLVFEAKRNNLVIVYGASDDLMEFEGAIHDECGAYDGTSVLVSPRGILPRWGSGISDEAVAEQYFKSKPSSRRIAALWDKYGYSWIYETEIPHATFTIMDDGEKYCRGIVFSLDDLQG